MIFSLTPFILSQAPFTFR